MIGAFDVTGLSFLFLKEISNYQPTKHQQKAHYVHLSKIVAKTFMMVELLMIVSVLINCVHSVIGKAFCNTYFIFLFKFEVFVKHF